MIKNHNDALDLFQREAAHGDDPEMKQWAAKTVDAIKEHLRMALENSASVGAYATRPRTAATTRTASTLARCQ